MISAATASASTHQWKSVVRFDFVDITNAPGLDAPHVHGFTIHLVDANHLELEFLFLAKGRESVEHIQLERVVPS